MPQAADMLQLERNKLNYLNQERSVNIRDHFKKEDQLKASGLEGIEVRDKVQALGKDDFLKLLITQLSHQDPTQPVKDEQFIAQMAQFSSLEQMQNVASSVHRMTDRQSLSIVGKFVMGKDSESDNMVSGIAKALIFDDTGKPFVRVNGRAVSVDEISVVGEPAYFAKPDRATGEVNGSAASPAEAKQSDAAPGVQAPAGELPVPMERKEEANPAETGTPKQPTGGTEEKKPLSFYDSFYGRALEKGSGTASERRA